MRHPAWTSGNILTLKSQSATIKCRLELRGTNSVSLALPDMDNPYRRLFLHIKDRTIPRPRWESGHSSKRYMGGKDAVWYVHAVSIDPLIITLSKVIKGNRYYLCCGSISSAAPLSAEPASQIELGDCNKERLYQESPATQSHKFKRAERRVSPRAQWAVKNAREVEISTHCGSGVAQCELSKEVVENFLRDGFVVLPKCAKEGSVDTAKAYINGRLAMSLAELGEAAGATAAGERANPMSTASAVHGKTDENENRGDDPAGSGGKGAAFAAKVWSSSAPELMGIPKTGNLARLIEQFIGYNQVDSQYGCQVALRFPGVRDDLVAGGAAVRSFVGERDWHTDGLRQGKKHSFSLLVGVCLEDCLVENRGNLCVWPGSHRWCHQHMRHPDGKIKRKYGWSNSDGPLPPLGSPVQLCMRKGDVVFAHSELAHCGGPLLGPSLRYMVYYRVRHVSWSAMRQRASLVSDMFVDLVGLKAAALRFSVPSQLLETPPPSGWSLDDFLGTNK